MGKGIHVSTMLYLIIAAIILIIFMPMLIRSAGAVWNQLLTSLGIIQPSLIDKAIVCSYYRCKYGINDRRTAEACEGNFPDYNKPAAPCDQGGLVCMSDRFLPDGKVCDEVAAAYPIEVELESDKEYEITKNSKFGDDGDADNICINYPGVEIIYCSRKEQTAGYGSYDECLNTHNCRLSTQFGGNFGYYGSGISKSIFLDSTIVTLAKPECADSVKIKPKTKLYVTTDYYTRIFSEDYNIGNVVPTLLQLKVGETSHKIHYCADGRRGIRGLFIIEDLDANGNKEGITAVSSVGSWPDVLSSDVEVKVRASCDPTNEIKERKTAYPISLEFCNSKYKLSAWITYSSDEVLSYSIQVQRLK